MSSTMNQPAVAELQRVTDFVGRTRDQIAKVVVGQDVVVERILIALFTGGHLLLQGVPGLAKTLLVSAISKAIDLQFARIQFTIDLLPSDILGSEILDQRTSEFRIHRGPVFTIVPRVTMERRTSFSDMMTQIWYRPNRQSV